MESLYNPDLMSEEEIKQTFVARQSVVDELIGLIERQPEGAGVQHAVLIAPRGMGKTTVLLMVQFAVRDRGLDSRWQAVRFPEESYGINDLADFWLEVLGLLAQESAEPALQQAAEQLKAEFRNANDLQEAAFARIKDWSHQHNKRLILLVDNLDLILSQINNERDNAQLRNVLMNDGTLMLIGGATTFFHEARSYDQPLYNFFKILDLNKLTFDEVQELLRQRANLEGRPNFDAFLQANRSRLRALEYFTNGNPRLVLMLYRIITKSEVIEVRRGLEDLLDQVTPYYKAKIESLPPQQRKILDHIARISSQTHEGLTPTEIASGTRLTPNAVSMQLKRLLDLGYVRSANVRGRKSYYTLSDALYALWYQMRFGRDARQKMRWLIDFLKSWYDSEELSLANQRLETRFQQFFDSGLVREAHDALTNRRYLVEAIDQPKVEELEKITCDYLKIGDIETLKQEILPTMRLGQFSTATLEALFREGCITEERDWIINASKFIDQIEIEIKLANEASTEKNDSLSLSYLTKSFCEACLDRLEQAKYDFQRSVQIAIPSRAWYKLSLFLCMSGAWAGHRDVVRDIIQVANKDEIFLPFIRAVEYLQTANAESVDKLSPELKDIVKEIIAELRSVVCEEEEVE